MELHPSTHRFDHATRLRRLEKLELIPEGIAYLDSSPTRILVLEAPIVLGWQAWCGLAGEYEIAAIAATCARKQAGQSVDSPLSSVG